ncbi:MAG: response regulator, partial [Kofleriaceae bacterium]
MTYDVLIIDDSATVRKLVEISLRGTALRPHFAGNGNDGIRLAATLAPAAILLDFVLPDMTGIDVCRALAGDARTETIPILVVTAKHERTRAQLAPFAAVTDFVTKPFAAADLLTRINRAIAGAAGRGPELARDPVERAAKLLFSRLRDGLALLPAQFGALDPGPIAPQLARRLLTPQVVERILADLRPLYEAAGSLAVSGDDALGPLGLGAMIDRAPGFSAKLRDAQLSSVERRILALCDGRLTVTALAARAAVAPHDVAVAARGLVARGLAIEVEPAPVARPVVICEPDVEEFQAPLRSLLQRRATPRELVAVDRLDDVVATSRRLRPCLVMVNASARTEEVCAIAQAL